MFLNAHIFNNNHSTRIAPFLYQVSSAVVDLDIEKLLHVLYLYI